MVKHFYLIHIWASRRHYYSGQCGPGSNIMTEQLTFPKARKLNSEMEFGIISMILIEVGSYPTTDMHSVYSTAPADCTVYIMNVLRTND